MLILHPFKNYCLSKYLPSTVILGAVNSGAKKIKEISLLVEFKSCYEGTMDVNWRNGRGTNSLESMKSPLMLISPVTSSRTKQFNLELLPPH